MSARVFLLTATLLAACAGGPSAAEETTAPAGSPTFSPGRSDIAAPGAPQRGPAMEITGVLGADSVEGGCAYLESAEGTLYEVMYPDGWRVQASPLELTNPGGTVVATGGERITVRGSEAAGMVSICQVGPMFRADEVLAIEAP